MRRSLPLLTTTVLASSLLGLSLTAPATAAADPGRGVAPPDNDDVSEAKYLGEGGFWADTTIGATRSNTDPRSLPGQHTVWYRYESAIGFPVRVTTTAESIDPSLGAPWVAYRETDAGLEKVAVGQSPVPPDQFSRERVAAFPTIEDDTYYIGVSNTSDGSDFGIGLERAGRPSTTSIAGMSYAGSGGLGQLSVEKGERPRIRVKVVAGFRGDRVPGRSAVSLEASLGESFEYEQQLEDGRTVFVLPKARRDYLVDVTYPGTARVEPSSEDAYISVQ